MAITEDAVAFYESLNLYERVGLGLVLVILTYITVGSFQPSGKRRQEARSRHVLASNVVIMFSIFISVPVLYAIAMIAGCSAAIAAFVGVLVYLAIGLLTGGAFLGIAVWGVGVLSVLYISDSTMTLGRITGLYTLFTVAIVLAYPGALLAVCATVPASCQTSQAYTVRLSHACHSLCPGVPGLHCPRRCRLRSVQCADAR